jgi:hypothetical protein
VVRVIQSNWKVASLLLVATIVVGIIGSCTTTASSLPEPNLPHDQSTGKVLYTGIVEFQSLSKSDLFDKISVWFAKTYVSSKEVVQLQKRDSGTIIGKGAIPVTVTFPPAGLVAGLYGETPYGVVYYTISVYVKDGKYKYEIADLLHEGNVKGTDVSMGAIERWKESRIGTDAQKEIRIEVNTKVNQLIQNLKDYVSKENATDF